MFSSQSLGNLSELHIVQDKAMDFRAVICLHQNGRGPAIGGCRFMPYPSFQDAIQDAIRLSKAMSYKAAISELPHDGGKAVIMQPANLQNREKLLIRFAEFVHSLGGKYITTIDSGTTQFDMSIIKNTTPFVTGYIDKMEDNNPSHFTAWGVYQGIKAALKIKYGHDSLKNIHVAIQGIGSVGYQLAHLLYNEGAQITVADLNMQMIEKLTRELKVNIVSPYDIYSVQCDVFSPCALGQVIHEESLSKLKTTIIAGAANEQLISDDMAQKLEKQNILYIPDYLINAGGLIHLALQKQGQNNQTIKNTVSLIADKILTLYELAKTAKQTLFQVTQSTAELYLSNKKSCYNEILVTGDINIR